ncbi:MAG: sulfite exporter TauE/SafE family protein [Gammaproteobacteria bacterium]
MDYSILFIISLVANTFSAFAGGGAGLFQLPALLFLGATFSIALATHKLASVALGVGATIRHLRESRLNRRYITIILISGLPGVFIGANIVLMIPDRAAEVSLGILTLFLGIYSRFQPELGQKQQLVALDKYRLIIGMLVLVLIGVLNGSLTSGTGLFVTIWLVRWFGFDYKHAVAYTLVLVGLFWNGFGALTLGLQAPIIWEWIPSLLLGSFIGGYLGAHLSIRQGNKWIKVVFEILSIAIGIKLIIG